MNEAKIRANQKAWVAALKSGAYQQATAYLRIDDADGISRYCCLGVACDISGLGEWKEHRNTAPNGLLYQTESGALDKTMPVEVQEYFGITSDARGIEFTTHLMELNDNEYTFKQIARANEHHFALEE